MGRSEYEGVNAAPILAAIGVLIAVALGSWWTALAVMDGSPGSVALRVVCSIVAGTYYIVMYRLARGRSVFSR